MEDSDEKDRVDGAVINAKAAQKASWAAMTQASTTAKQLAAITISITPWDQISAQSFWPDWDVRMASAEANEMIKAGNITNVDDNKKTKSSSTSFKRAKHME